MTIRLFIILFISSISISKGIDFSYGDNRKWKIHYDSKNRILRKTKRETFFTKGYIIHFDTLGNKIKYGPTKFSKKHGKWTTFENGNKKINRYKFGIDKRELINSNGNKYIIILTYGYHAYKATNDEYNLKYIPIANCIVNKKNTFMTAIHNFPVYIKMRLKYGKNWETKIKENLL